MFKIYDQSTKECLYDDTLVNANDCKSREPKLKFEASKAGLLTFISKPGTSIKRNDIVYVTKSRFGEDPKIYWAGRVLSDERNSYNEKEIECEGVLAFLNDVPQVPSKVPVSSESIHQTALKSFEQMIEFYNSLAFDAPEYKFKLSEATKTAFYSKLVFPTRTIKEISESILVNFGYSVFLNRTRESTFTNIQNEFLDKLGGQIRVRHNILDVSGYADNGDPIYSFENIIDYIDSFDEENRSVSEQSVEFGKNLVSITKKASIEELATAYIPQGRTLTDVEKSWPYIQALSSAKYKKIETDPNAPAEIDYKLSKYIDSETGAVMSSSDASFAVSQDIPVRSGERFFLSTYIEGPPDKVTESKAYAGAVAYAVVTSSGKIVLSGGSAKNSVETQTNVVEIAKVELKDQSITIPELEDSNETIVLRIARKIDSSHRFVLKKFNQKYGENYLTIMSYPIVNEDSDGMQKPLSHELGSDVYPVSTANPNVVESFEQAKVLYNMPLVREFGLIYKVFTDSSIGQDSSEVVSLYNSACRSLKKMNEKIDLSIEAVDLSYIDSTVPSFNLLDLVSISSPPHGVNVKLPIMKIDLPLDAPEKAIYTMENDNKLAGNTPSYVSQYMSEAYKKV